MNKPIAVGVGLLVLVLLLLFSTTFTVKYNEVAIKATFGETDENSVVTEPGLHYRLPVFIDTVTKLDTRLQLVESPMEEITTKDGLQIVVRAYLLWQVDTETPAGPLEFFRSHTSIDNATQSLRGQFRTVFTGVLAEYGFADLIGASSQLAQAETDIRTALAGALAEQGVRADAVGISRIMLPPKTSSAVLSRMQATRNVLAEGERNSGTAEAERIRSEGNTLADKIRAFADARAEEIRAVGEREAQKYLAQMGEAEDLAIFLSWLDTLERTLNQNTTVFLPTTFEPFHLLNPEIASMRNGIPQPGPVAVETETAKDEPVSDAAEETTSETGDALAERRD